MTSQASMMNKAEDAADNVSYITEANEVASVVAFSQLLRFLSS